MMQLDRDEGAHLARAWTDGHNVDLLFSWRRRFSVLEILRFGLARRRRWASSAGRRWARPVGQRCRGGGRHRHRRLMILRHLLLLLRWRARRRRRRRSRSQRRRCGRRPHPRRRMGSTDIRSNGWARLWFRVRALPNKRDDRRRKKRRKMSTWICRLNRDCAPYPRQTISFHHIAEETTISALISYCFFVATKTNTWWRIAQAETSNCKIVCR